MQSAAQMSFFCLSEELRDTGIILCGVSSFVCFLANNDAARVNIRVETDMWRPGVKTSEPRLTCSGPELKLIISAATAIIVIPTLPPGF